MISVTPHITERLSATKASWLYARRPLLKMTSSLLMEEICVLGALLMFGEGPNKLYSTITPFRNNDSGRIYCVSHFISILVSLVKHEARNLINIHILSRGLSFV